MVELSPEIATIIMLGGLLVGVLTGVPLGFAIGIIALVVGYMVFGGESIGILLYTRIFKMITTYVILAVPLFIFMGSMLQRSGITERLYEVLYLWLGALRGGLAIATVLIGTLLAACVGIVTASVSMLAFIGLPSMISRGYSKDLACGSVAAGGTLGILIPPSIMLVLYGPMAQLSVGKLFMGAIFPGLVLSGLYCSYIALRCLIWPKTASAVPVEERRAVSFLKKTVMLFTSLVPPVFLVMAVLGSIFFGVAAPTEAAAVGAFAAVLLALAYRRLTWEGLKGAGLETGRLSGVIYFIVAASIAFTGVFIGSGCGKVVSHYILAAPGGRWGSFAVIMFICFILGMFIDWLGIILIMVPIVQPLAIELGFDPLWFGMMICVNLQMSFMTPPFAYAIFIIRSAALPELGITTPNIIRGIIPFVLLIVVGLGICIAFPQIILWLPSIMIK